MLARIFAFVLIAAFLTGCAMPVVVSQTVMVDNPKDAPKTWVTVREDGSLLVEWGGDGKYYYVFGMTMDFEGEDGGRAKEGGWWLTDANSLVFSPQQTYEVFAWSVWEVAPSGVNADGLILTQLSEEAKGDTLK